MALERVELTIADIGVALLLPRDTAEQARATYSVFLGGSPSYEICAESLLPPSSVLGIPQVAANNSSIYIQMAGRFVLEIEPKSGCGRLCLAASEGTGTAAPVAIEAALRSLYAVLLARQANLLLHACAVDLHGRGVLLAGPSGAGKSAIASLFSREGRLTDELAAVTCGVDAPVVWATPFRGTGETPMRNCCVPLRTGFCISRGSRARLRPLSAGDALAKLMRCTAIPVGSPELDGSAFSGAARLAEVVPWRWLEHADEQQVVGIIIRELDLVS